MSTSVSSNPPSTKSSTAAQEFDRLIRQIRRELGLPDIDFTILYSGGVYIVMSGLDRIGVISNGSNGNDLLLGTAELDVLIGNGGDDTLDGGDGNDILIGGNGQDTMRGGAGNDILLGGKGDDLLQGGTGSDLYYFNLGDGRDTIVEGSANSGDKDVLHLGAGISGTEVQAFRNGQDLVLRISDSDRVTIRNWFLGRPYQLDSIRFADGTVWIPDAITNGVVGVIGTDYHDRLNGGAGDDLIDGDRGNDVINGGAGQDRLSGGEGDDTLLGGAGDDILRGGSGNDRLEGGTGNDFLDGGSGSDTYVFRRGDGQDVIVDSGTDSKAFDVIEFGAGITAANVTLQRDGADLVLAIGNGDQLTVRGWFSATRKPISEIRFADGLRWSPAQLANMPVYVTGGAGNDTIGGSDAIDIIRAGAGDDAISGGSGNDILEGESGDDTLMGDQGDDTLIGGRGNDLLIGGGGRDVYLFDLGDGRDTLRTDASDILRFGRGIDQTTVRFQRSQFDLVIRISDADQVTITAWFLGNIISAIEFADGTQLTAAQISARQIEVPGSPVDDILFGGAEQNLIDGGDGNDTISGGNGNDVLRGGSGDDVLNGDSGDDILEGGAGDDLLIGNWGSDTFLFDLGDGRDTVQADSADILRLGSDITADMVSFWRNQQDLVIRISETDQITVTNWFAGYPFGRIEFADGTRLSVAQINAGQIGIRGSATNDTLTGGTEANLIDGGDGDDNISGGAGDDLLIGGSGRDRLNGDQGDDLLYGGAGDDLLIGGSGDDRLHGDGGNDTLRGGYGSDLLRGGDGDDILDGGVGDDIMEGGNGNDTYIYRPNDGRDVILDVGEDGNSCDVVEFIDGIRPDMITASRVGQDLVLRLDAFNQLVISAWFTDRRYQIEEFRFADGTRWYGDQFAGLPIRQVGTRGNDTMVGGSGNDYLDGAAGNDRIRGGAGDDVLDGGEGDDTLRGDEGDDILNGDNGNDMLYGGNGDDTLSGGRGNDMLMGGAGDDIYVFNAGDGRDVISDNDGGSGGGESGDQLRLGSGLDPQRLWLSQVGSDLRISVLGSQDTVVIRNWYAGQQYRIESIVAGNGQMLWESQVEQLVQAMAALGPPAAGWTSLPSSYQTALNPVLVSSWM